MQTADPAHAGDTPDLWEKVVRKLHADAMPPPGRPRPGRSTMTAFVERLESSLDAAAATQPDPGRVPIHRLNQAEYTNAVRDLLKLDVDARALLPADDADQHGFDNNAGILSVSPVLMERYLAAARKISRLAIGDPGARPAAETYRVPKLLVQDARINEDFPFGSRGNVAIRHHFPLNGEYSVRVRLSRTLEGYIRGLGEAHSMEVRLDGRLVKRFVVGGEHQGLKRPPESFAGSGVLGDPVWEAYTHAADADLHVRFPVPSGARTVSISFNDGFFEPEGVLQPPPSPFVLEYDEMWHGFPSVDSVEIVGPFSAGGPGETPSRTNVFSCRPARATEEAACARRILATLARQGYRRPATDDDLEVLLQFYAAGRKERDFDYGIQMALERLLIDPEFLFRMERGPRDVGPSAPYRLDDIALASRLSFFFWSSIPDEPLLNVAVSDRLHEPATLSAQLRRMLADPRAETLVENFAAQWLQLRALRGVTPDPYLFPDFDENLREAFQKETAAFFANELAEDRSILNLLTANYTFLNERLARHYGIPNVYGDRLRRVVLPDAGRGGLLGQGAMLTVTSYANRTSPVLRGKWVLDNLLGAPPPMPPPGVPPLKEDTPGTRPTSLRERMSEHRSNPACAACHLRMDALGFALENFDAIGKWRGSEASGPIDASAILPDGTEFDGLPGLRKVIVARPEEFVRTVTEKLLGYAIGRGIEPTDGSAVRKIIRDAAASDYKWSSIISGIVNSAPFRMQRSEP